MADEREPFRFSNAIDDTEILATDTIAATQAAAFLNEDPSLIKEVKQEDENNKKGDGKEGEKNSIQKAAEEKERLKAEKEKKSKEILKQLEDGEDEPELDADGNPIEKEDDKELDADGNPIKKEEKPKEGAGDNNKLDQNTFEVLGEELFNLGIFRKSDEEEGDIKISTPEALQERFELEKRRDAIQIVDNFIERFGEDYKDMFDNVFVKGVSPQDYIQKFVKVEEIANIPTDDPDGQERLVRELYRRDGRSGEYINKQVAKLKEWGSIEDEAVEAKKILLEREQNDIQQAARNKELERMKQKEIKDVYYSNVNKILTDKIKAKDFDGIPVDQKTAQTVAKYLTAEKYQTNSGKLLTEFEKDILELEKPENHPLKVKVALLLNLLKEDPTLSRIIKKGGTKAAQTAFSKLGTKSSAQNIDKKTNEAEKKTSSSSWF